MRVAGGLGPVGDGHAGEEDHGHGGEDRPALPLVPDHAAEGVGQRRGDGRMESIWRKLVSGVGFSKGCAELAFQKPPPLVPSCLMAICEAAGPWRWSAWRLRAWSHRHRRRGSAARPARPGTAPQTTQTAAGRRACSGSDRPRSCRWCCADGAREAADQRDRRARCRSRPRRSSAW